MAIVGSIFLFVAAPLCIGSVWRDDSFHESVLYQYVMGFVTMMGVFELICVPAVFARMKFHVLVWIYTGVLVVWIGLVLARKVRSAYGRKKDKESSFGYALRNWVSGKMLKIKNMDCFEWIYLVMFIVLLGVQIYFAVFYHISWVSSDDETYGAYSAAIVYDDAMFYTDPLKGERLLRLPYKYAFQGIYVYTAYLAVVTGASVPVIMHTILPVVVILASYGVCYLMAGQFIEKWDDRIIFMIFLAAIYIFGYHSHFSTTFRLLGANWHGKAILAVFVFPLLMATYGKWIYEKYTFLRGLQIGMISCMSISLTLGGIVTMAAVTGVLLVLAVRKLSDWKVVLYMVWGNLLPVLCGIVYMVKR